AEEGRIGRLKGLSGGGVRRHQDVTHERRPRRLPELRRPRRVMIHGEGTAIVRGVTPIEVFYFVLDPAQYTKADTKIVWVAKLADMPDGMIAREDDKFLGLLPGVCGHPLPVGGAAPYRRAA